VLHFSLAFLQNDGWRVQEEDCLLFTRIRATARVVFYYLNTRNNAKKMVNLDEENLATTSTGDNGTPATTTTTTTMMMMVINLKIVIVIVIVIIIIIGIK